MKICRFVSVLGALALCGAFVLADGDEILGPPSIEIAEGAEILAAGTGLFAQPGTIELDVPAGAEVKQVLVYWQGRGEPDNTIRLNLTDVITGDLIGNTSGLNNNSWAFRKDITEMALIGPGSNSVTVDEMAFSDKNDGAALLVIIQEGPGASAIAIRDGMDFAYIFGPTEVTRVSEKLEFTFADATVARDARIWIFVGDGTPDRPDEFELTIGEAAPIILPNEGRGRDGEEWDTVPLNFEIPAGASKVAVQLFSRATPTVTGTPDSLSWVVGTFEQPCTGLIGNFVWEDLNGNGIQDADEPGIPGIEVVLTTPSDSTFGTTTDADGYYSFGGLCAGDYEVHVTESTVPPDFVQTPCEQGNDPTVDSNCQPALVTLPEDFTEDLTIDFGYFSPCTGSIGDFVWEDLNSNGLQDDGEPGISGVTVSLYDSPGGSAIATVATDENGYYLFSGLCEGNYWVDTDTPAGMEPTDCEIGDDTAIDSNCTPALVMLTDNDSEDLTIDFGFITPCSGRIGDFVWDDYNMDGLQDDGEPGIAGVTVTLYDSPGGQAISITVTDEDGYYLFTDLCAGSYWVVPDTPAGMEPTDCEVGADETIDSNCSPAIAVLDDNHSEDLTIDFGFYEPELGDDGCTPGFWRTPQHFSAWTGYAPGQPFSSVFDRTITVRTKGEQGNNRPYIVTDPTLLEAVWATGGGVNALARHTIAALLNASNPHVAYAYSEAMIISLFQSAYDSEDYQTAKDMLAMENERGCPIDGQDEAVLREVRRTSQTTSSTGQVRSRRLSVR